MKLKLAAAIFALVAIPTLAFGQQGSPPPKVPKPTKADVQKVAEIISSDKAKLQAYCDSKKLYDQMGAAYKRNDSKTADALSKQADAVVSKLGPRPFSPSRLFRLRSEKFGAGYSVLEGSGIILPCQTGPGSSCPLRRLAGAIMFRGRALSRTRTIPTAFMAWRPFPARHRLWA